jgi:membrane-associated PAP2 superfamily phosphatase
MKFNAVFAYAFWITLSLELSCGVNLIYSQELSLSPNYRDIHFSSNKVDDLFNYQDFKLCLGSSSDSGKNNTTKNLDSLNFSNKYLLLDPANRIDTVNYFNSTDYNPKWHSMITNIPSDWLKFFKGYMTTDNMPMMLGIAISTAGLIVSDDATWKESDKFYKRSNFNKSFSNFFTEFGDGRTQFALAAVFGAYGFVGKDKRAVRTASQIVEVVLGCGAVIQVLKHVTGRESPFVSTQPGGVWRFFPNQIEYHKKVPHYDAYPSGHIATSMATFIVIAENYPEYKWIEPAGWALAACIGFGMANTGIHWYSDYPLGIALGYAFGKLVAKPEKISDEYQSKNIFNNIKLYPSYTINGAGLSLYLEF